MCRRAFSFAENKIIRSKRIVSNTMRKRNRLCAQCILLLSLVGIISGFALLPSVEEVGQRLLQRRNEETAESSLLPLKTGDNCGNRTKEECLHETYREKRRLNPSVGEGIKVLVLPIMFADHVDREVPTMEYLEEFFNGEGSSEVNEVGSVREWLRRNSNGKYSIQFVVRDWDVSTRTEKETAGGTSGLGQNFYPFFQFALDKVDNDPEHDWWSGFVDPEGFLYHLIVLHSGYMAESSKCRVDTVVVSILELEYVTHLLLTIIYISIDLYRRGFINVLRS